MCPHNAFRYIQKTSAVNICLLCIAKNRPVNGFGVYIEQLLWVQRTDGFKIIVISKHTATELGNLIFKSNQSILFGERETIVI